MFKVSYTVYFLLLREDNLIVISTLKEKVSLLYNTVIKQKVNHYEKKSF